MTRRHRPRCSYVWHLPSSSSRLHRRLFSITQTPSSSSNSVQRNMQPRLYPLYQHHRQFHLSSPACPHWPAIPTLLHRSDRWLLRQHHLRHPPAMSPSTTHSQTLSPRTSQILATAAAQRAEASLSRPPTAQKRLCGYTAPLRTIPPALHMARQRARMGYSSNSSSRTTLRDCRHCRRCSRADSSRRRQ